LKDINGHADYQDILLLPHGVVELNGMQYFEKKDYLYGIYVPFSILNSRIGDGDKASKALMEFIESSYLGAVLSVLDDSIYASEFQRRSLDLTVDDFLASFKEDLLNSLPSNRPDLIEFYSRQKPETIFLTRYQAGRALTETATDSGFKDLVAAYLYSEEPSSFNSIAVSLDRYATKNALCLALEEILGVN
jgi:hypothetical protein